MKRTCSVLIAALMLAGPGLGSADDTDDAKRAGSRDDRTARCADFCLVKSTRAPVYVPHERGAPPARESGDSRRAADASKEL